MKQAVGDSAISTPPHQADPSARRQRWFGIAAMLLSATAFGWLGVFARLAYQAGAEPITVLCMRFSIAALVMFGILHVRGQRLPRGKVLIGLILLGGIGYVAQSMAYFVALTMASAGLVAVLLYLYPGLVTLLAVVFFKERLTPRMVLALVLALIGSALAIGPIGGGKPLGIILAISGAVIYAIYITAGSQITARAGAIPSSTVIMSAAAVVYTGIMLARGPVWPATTGGWLAIVGIALVSTVLAIVMFFVGMERIGPTAASTISALEPLVSVGAAVVVLHEPISIWQLAGGLLILTAVVLLARSS
ncbi:DMT family transporter [Herpetosiphon geysericola]|uniref:DMT family transporter n=1 Tax=Herpetosiphon geysericola TaxID=70996 RepID=UPI0006C92605|nr:DMT family transporter [Herpetosiphon geysericola]